MHKPQDPHHLGLSLNKAASVEVESGPDIESSSKEGLVSARGVSVLDALRMRVLKECSESPLGTCLLAELGRFVEVLDLYKPMADFPIE